MDLKIGQVTYSVPVIAIVLMLIAILIPSVKYSFGLDNPSPSELLVAIAIALFSSVLFLWILDATSILRFRNEWVSKSVYGAAIVSVLGTSVGVYKDYFNTTVYPYLGKWEVNILNIPDSTVVFESSMAITYSEYSNKYWGYSSTSLDELDSTKVISVELSGFDVKSAKGTFKLLYLEHHLTLPIIFYEKNPNEISASGGKYEIKMKRPNY